MKGYFNSGPTRDFQKEMNHPWVTRWQFVERATARSELFSPKEFGRTRSRMRESIKVVVWVEEEYCGIQGQFWMKMKAYGSDVTLGGGLGIPLEMDTGMRRVKEITRSPGSLKWGVWMCAGWYVWKGNMDILWVNKFAHENRQHLLIQYNSFLHLLVSLFPSQRVSWRVLEAISELSGFNFKVTRGSFNWCFRDWNKW